LLEVLRLQIIHAKAPTKNDPKTKKPIQTPPSPDYMKYVTQINLKGNEISATVLQEIAQYTEILKREDKRLQIRSALTQIDRNSSGGIEEEEFKALLKLLTGTEPNKKEIKTLMGQYSVTNDSTQNSIALENLLLAKCSGSPSKTGVSSPWEALVQVRHTSNTNAAGNPMMINASVAPRPALNPLEKSISERLFLQKDLPNIQPSMSAKIQLPLGNNNMTTSNLKESNPPATTPPPGPAGGELRTASGRFAIVHPDSSPEDTNSTSASAMPSSDVKPNIPSPFTLPLETTIHKPPASTSPLMDSPKMQLTRTTPATLIPKRGSTGSLPAGLNIADLKQFRPPPPPSTTMTPAQITVAVPPPNSTFRHADSFEHRREKPLQMEEHASTVGKQEKMKRGELPFRESMSAVNMKSSFSSTTSKQEQSDPPVPSVTTSGLHGGNVSAMSSAASTPRSEKTDRNDVDDQNDDDNSQRNVEASSAHDRASSYDHGDSFAVYEEFSFKPNDALHAKKPDGTSTLLYSRKEEEDFEREDEYELAWGPKHQSHPSHSELITQETSTSNKSLPPSLSVTYQQHNGLDDEVSCDGTNEGENETLENVTIESVVYDVRINGADRGVARVLHSDFQHGMNLLEFPEVPFRNLVALVLSHNLLTSLELFKETRLPALKILDLSWNKLYKIQEEELCAFPRLEVLDLSQNNFKSIPNLMQNGLLRALNLAKNQIKSVKNLELLENLEVLNLSHNRITSIQALRPLSLNNNLLHLDLDANEVIADKICRRNLVLILNVCQQLVTLGSVQSAVLHKKEKKLLSLSRSVNSADNVLSNGASSPGSPRGTRAGASPNKGPPSPEATELIEPGSIVQESLFVAFEGCKNMWIANACDTIKLLQDPEQPLKSPRSPNAIKKMSREEQRLKDELRSKQFAFKSRAKALVSPPIAPNGPPPLNGHKKNVTKQSFVVQQRRVSELSAPKHPPVDQQLFKKEKKVKTRPSFDVPMSVAERLALAKEQNDSTKKNVVSMVGLTIAENIEVKRFSRATRSSMIHVKENQQIAAKKKCTIGRLEAPSLIKVGPSPNPVSRAQRKSIAVAIAASKRSSEILNVLSQLTSVPRSSVTATPSTGQQLLDFRLETRSNMMSGSKVVHIENPRVWGVIGGTKETETNIARDNKNSIDGDLLSKLTFLHQLAVQEFLSHVDEELSTSLTALNVLIKMSTSTKAEMKSKLKEYRNRLESLNILDESDSKGLYLKAKNYHKNNVSNSNSNSNSNSQDDIFHQVDMLCQASFDKLAHVKDAIKQLLIQLDTNPPGSKSIRDACDHLKKDTILCRLLIDINHEEEEEEDIVENKKPAKFQSSHFSHASKQQPNHQIPNKKKNTFASTCTMETIIQEEMEEETKLSTTSTSTGRSISSLLFTRPQTTTNNIDVTKATTKPSGRSRSSSTNSSMAIIKVEEHDVSDVAMVADMDITADLHNLEISISMVENENGSLSAPSSPINAAPSAMIVKSESSKDTKESIIQAVKTKEKLEVAVEHEATKQDEDETEEQYEEEFEEDDQEEVQTDQVEVADSQGNSKDKQEEAENGETEDDTQGEMFGDWEKGFDSNTNHYFWFNHSTNESSWEPPEGWPYALEKPFEEEESEEPKQEEEHELTMEESIAEDLSVEDRIAQALQGGGNKRPTSSFDDDDGFFLNDVALPDF
jgi:hypothetical protein